MLISIAYAVRSAAPRRGQRGLSIVELMVGIAVGLFIVAAAATLVATQLSDNRRLLLETQVQQDLRAAADIMTRDLRRSGYWSQGAVQVWAPTSTSPVVLNPNHTVSPTEATSSSVLYGYDRDVAGFESRFGFRLSAGSAKFIETKFSPPGSSDVWQALTDDKVLNITNVTVTPTMPAPQKLTCPKLCLPANDTACWPQIGVREFDISITGQAVSDPQVRRTVTTRVRLRNDLMQLNVPGGGPGDFVACPP